MVDDVLPGLSRLASHTYIAISLYARRPQSKRPLTAGDGQQVVYIRQPRSLFARPRCESIGTAPALDHLARRYRPNYDRRPNQPVAIWVGVEPPGPRISKPSGVLRSPGAVPGVPVSPYCQTNAPV